jgi:RHS repeat-associated protein
VLWEVPVESESRLPARRSRRCRPRLEHRCRSTRNRIRGNSTSSYNRALGEGISRDPLGEEDGPNVYDFALNNLVNYVDRLGLHVFSIDITAKSWIAKPIIPGYVPGGFQPMLYAAVVEVSLLTDDNVANDAIDGKYRFLSQKVISVECDGSTVKSASFSGLFTDVGLEGFYGIGLYPPPAVVVYDTHSSSSSAVYFTWKIKARPRPEAEYFVFDPVKPRHGHVYIWHQVFGKLTCSCGSPSVDLNLDASEFPSAALYYRVDGILYPRAVFLPQGPMSELWDPSPFDPTLVR